MWPNTNADSDMDLRGKRIILGSNSPRRKELLAGLNIDFTIDTNNHFEECYRSDTPHLDVPVLMAEGKSLGFHRPLAEDEILITSDTMVLCGDEIMGKPRDEADAARMLRCLSGRDHQVVTAVTLRDSRRTETVSDIAHVWFKELTDDEINYYISHFRPFDKAGAYGIQEWIGYIGITRIEGSFYTIMGFPVHLVYEKLRAFLAL